MRPDLQRALLECHGGEGCEGADKCKSAIGQGRQEEALASFSAIDGVFF
jgi:hypothetical protein